MDVLDEQGRLFGLVNVIDALVVVLAAFVVVAGVSLVLQPEPADRETDTRSVVLDLGPQPDYLAERLAEGETVGPDDGSSITIDEVYLGPQAGSSRVLLAATVGGPVSGGSITYGGAPLRLGRQLTISTDAYQVSGRIRGVDSGLDARQTRVVVNHTVDTAVANAVEVGDTFTLAGRQVATIESVEAYATADPDRRRVFIGISLRTVDLGSGPQFGQTPIERGAVIPFRTEDYASQGNVVRVGATEPPGEPATREVLLALDGVPSRVAEELRPGMTETVAGRVNARITSVETRPATALVSGEDGLTIVGEHPSREDVTLTAEFSVRETATGPTFKGGSLEENRQVPLDLGPITIEATVVDAGG